MSEELVKRILSGPSIPVPKRREGYTSASQQALYALPGFTITMSCPWLSSPEPWRYEKEIRQAPRRLPATGSCRPCQNGVADYEATITVTRADGTPLPDGTRVDVYAIVNGQATFLGSYQTQNSAITIYWPNAPPTFDLKLVAFTPWKTTEVLYIRDIVNCCPQ